MTHRIVITIFLGILFLTDFTRSQDSSFTPYFRFDPTSGNYFIGYWKDSSRIYEALFVPPTKIIPEIFATVVPEKDKSVYKYKIVNQADSKQKILGFDLQLLRPIDPLSLPNGWFIRPYKYQSYVQFVYEDEVATSIPIGGKLEFLHLSNGLPSIIIARFIGDVDTIDLAFDMEPSYQVYNLIDSIENKLGKRYVVRATIGPTDPPNPFVPVVFLDTLLSYTRQSGELGWIIDKNSEKRINRKIELAKELLQMAENCELNPKKKELLDEAVKEIKDIEIIDAETLETPKIIIEENKLKEINEFKKEISKKKPNDAKCKELCKKIHTWLAIKTLESLVREVEILNRISEKGKKQYLASEAYALLKYNTEYLIDQLGKK
jgi:hypothetical protein